MGREMVKSRREWKCLGGSCPEESPLPALPGEGAVGTGGTHGFRRLCFSLVAHSVRRMDVAALTFWLFHFPEGYYPGISRL